MSAASTKVASASAIEADHAVEPATAHKAIERGDDSAAPRNPSDVFDCVITVKATAPAKNAQVDPAPVTKREKQEHDRRDRRYAACDVLVEVETAPVADDGGFDIARKMHRFGQHEHRNPIHDQDA